MRYRRMRYSGRSTAQTAERVWDSRRDGVGSLRAPSPVQQSPSRSYRPRDDYAERPPPTQYNQHYLDSYHRGYLHHSEYPYLPRHGRIYEDKGSSYGKNYIDLVPTCDDHYVDRPLSKAPHGPRCENHIDQPSAKQRFEDNLFLTDSKRLERKDLFEHKPSVDLGCDTSSAIEASRVQNHPIIRTSSLANNEPLLPLKEALTHLYPDFHASFWTSENDENWKRAPVVVEQDRLLRKQEQAERDMADPFEVRMRFSGQLQHLNASVVSAQKAAQYAIKHRDQSEDLHSCILEQLERNSMNTRANIMYFIEPFLELAEKERNGNDYIRRMQRDIIRVVDAVCPEDGSGAANVKVVRKVLRGLMSKGFLLEQTVDEIEECLKDRAAASHADMGFSSPVRGGSDSKTNRSGVNGSTGGGNGEVMSSNKKSAKLEKRQIEQRIEEDRERHKKMRENMWVTPKNPSARGQKLWEDQSDAGDDDDRLGLEDEDENIDLTGTGQGQDIREHDHTNGESRNVGSGRDDHDRRNDADGDVRMNGGYSR